MAHTSLQPLTASQLQPGMEITTHYGASETGRYCVVCVTSSTVTLRSAYTDEESKYFLAELGLMSQQRSQIYVQRYEPRIS